MGNDESTPPAVDSSTNQFKIVQVPSDSDENVCLVAKELPSALVGARNQSVVLPESGVVVKFKPKTLTHFKTPDKLIVHTSRALRMSTSGRRSETRSWKWSSRS